MTEVGAADLSRLLHSKRNEYEYVAYRWKERFFSIVMILIS
jgi:hypothetical protein